jgi:hypothetical protein
MSERQENRESKVNMYLNCADNLIGDLKAGTDMLEEEEGGYPGADETVKRKRLVSAFTDQMREIYAEEITDREQIAAFERFIQDSIINDETGRQTAATYFDELYMVAVVGSTNGVAKKLREGFQYFKYRFVEGIKQKRFVPMEAVEAAKTPKRGPKEVQNVVRRRVSNMTINGTREAAILGSGGANRGPGSDSFATGVGDTDAREVRGYGARKKRRDSTGDAQEGAA